MITQRTLGGRIGLALAVFFAWTGALAQQQQQQQQQPQQQPQQQRPPAAGVGGVLQVRLPFRAFAFAGAGDGKPIAATDPEAGTVVLFPNLARGSTDGAITRRVGRTPASIVHKRVDDKGYFLVVCADEGTLEVLDDATGETVKTIRLNDGGTWAVVAPADPSLAVAYVNGSGPGTGAAGAGPLRVDLRTMEVRGRVRLGDGYDDYAVSADGAYLYARKLGVSPEGIRAFRIVEQPGAAGVVGVPVHGNHTNSRRYVTDPVGLHTAVDERVSAADLRREVAELPEAPLAFLPDRPVLLTLGGGQLEAYSTNTFRPVGAAVRVGDVAATPAVLALEPLRPPRGARRAAAGGDAPPPAEMEPDPPPPDNWHHRAVHAAQRNREAASLKLGTRQQVPYRPYAVPDAKAKAVLVCAEDRVAVVPLAALKLPDEPLLAARVEGSTRLAPGERAALKVTRLDERASLELAEGPKGMKLDGDGRLTWTPTAADVGTARVVLRLSSGDIERMQDVSLTVARPAVGLPFAQQVMAIAGDGATAVIAAPVAQDHGGGFAGGIPPMEGAGGGMGRPLVRLAVVDLVNRQVVADRALDEQIMIGPGGLAIDAHHVYAALQQADAFLALSPADLGEVRRVFTTGRAQRLVPVNDRRLYVRPQQGPVRAFAVPTLAPLDPPAPPPDPNAHFHQDHHGAPVAVGDGWYYRGVLWDGLLAAPRLLVDPQGILPVPSGYQGRGRDNRPGPDAAPTALSPWGTSLMHGQLQRTSGQTIGSLGPVSIVMSARPAAAVLSRQQVQGQPPRFRVELALHELVSGRRVDAIVLSDEPMSDGWSGGGGHDGGAGMQLFETGDGLVALAGTRIFFIGTNDLPAAEKFPPPLHFAAQQDVIWYDTANGAILKPQVHGGRAPLVFAAAARQDGVMVDARTGEITILPGAFLQQIAQTVQQITGNNNRGRRGGGGGNATEVNRYRERIAGLYEQITGAPPTGLPLAVTVGVVARDADQQTATQDYTLLIDVDPGVPVQPIAPSGPRNVIERPAAAPRRKAPVTAVATKPATRPAAADGDAAALRQRLDELERRNHELEAQLQQRQPLERGKK